jgi:hypothetical protein
MCVFLPICHKQNRLEQQADLNGMDFKRLQQNRCWSKQS